MVAKKEAKAVKTVDLHAKLAELRADLGDHSRSLAANELPNPRVIRNVRRDIARTLTAINAERKGKESKDA
ncbi:50S ribosomal protein L29 [Candidatus Saccharibacteria bacterium]|nr:50S ribosomal protein L29 [Candidatus Saccharibacteria bacterium]